MPFIGSQISLISKSGIRYEGVLHTINMEESSIALQSGTCPRSAQASRYPSNRRRTASLTRCLLCASAGLQCAPSAQKADGQMAPRSPPATRHMSSSSSGVSGGVFPIGFSVVHMHQVLVGGSIH